eukprot:217794-Pleurochrysis_carterae.AAC.1
MVKSRARSHVRAAAPARTCTGTSIRKACEACTASARAPQDSLHPSMQARTHARAHERLGR